ncbi:hypothetical protein M3I53_05620 [Paraburkholderia sp. CNPSo 3272]|uniref:hypothetical protein n=1 Tax=Paraburkholderia sp. CNPSo 3272 TaxID=2940931 RepID=UPI0020B7A244|nr:hypothetical protein [Paraburkholderia sp. CNPSo 3272]MCP3722614.1 hypothetical protein [Paraburkholderia sp. CNPSo 3272]
MLSLGQSITRRDRWAWVFQKYNVATGAGTLQGSQQYGQVFENSYTAAQNLYDPIEALAQGFKKSSPGAFKNA